MPRDPSGNYSLPAGNPVVSGELVDSGWANSTMDDLASEMTDSLSRSGKGGFTAPTGFVDKSGSVPGINFVNEPTSGFKRETTGDVRVQVQGNDKMRWTAAGDAEVRRNGTFYPVAIDPADRKVMYGEGGVTIIWHYGDTAAPGWSIEEPDANIRNLVIGPALGGGVIGGTQDPTDFNASVSTTVTVTITGVTDGHVLTPAQMPRHRHGYTGTPGSAAGVGTTVLPQGTSYTDFQGNDEPHPHTLTNVPGSGTGTGTTGSMTPRYARGVMMKLDA